MAHPRPAARAVLAAVATVAAAMVALDLTWLGVIARPFYAAQLGPLMAREPLVLVAAAFYVFYVATVVIQAVAPARAIPDAAARGAWLGFVAYATYELTNWAVIQGWPGLLVPVDLAWGVILTATVAGLGRWAWEWAAATVAPRS